MQRAVEPFDGGDYQMQSHGRVVAQVKIRAPHRRWTPGEIIGDVLPDLFKAVRPRAGDSFQFVTNNDAGCEEFRRFLAWVSPRDEAAPEDISTTFRLGKNGKALSGEAVVDRVADSLGFGSERVKVRNFLRSFSIVLRHRSELVIAINKTLEILVGNRDGVRAARKLLIHDLLEASTTGRRLTTVDLLESNNLDPRRLMLATLLPKQLRRKLPNPGPTVRGFGGIIIGQQDASGNRMPQAPEFSGYAGLDHTIVSSFGEFQFNTTVTYQSRIYFTPDNLYSQGRYATVAAFAKWTAPSKKYDVTLWGRNLTDKRTFGTLTVAGYRIAGTPNEPLSFGGRVGVHF